MPPILFIKFTILTILLFYHENYYFHIVISPFPYYSDTHLRLSVRWTKMPSSRSSNSPGKGSSGMQVLFYEFMAVVMLELGRR